MNSSNWNNYHNDKDQPYYYYSDPNTPDTKEKSIMIKTKYENKPTVYVPVRSALPNYTESLDTLRDSDKDDNNAAIMKMRPYQNFLLYRILKYYYKRILELCGAVEQKEGYLYSFPNDEDVEELKRIAYDDWASIEKHCEDNMKIAYGHKTKELGNTNELANKTSAAFIDFIAKNLTLLWANLGDEISDKDGNKVTLKGVYKVSNTIDFNEMKNAMDKLGIHQMIMQGPPGTSKTYSAKGFLKHVGELDDNALKNCHITNYDDWNKTARIAWDIVQFHPSYGYEDFVRGIEVSTDKKGEDGNSSISYNTVNKILGKMAKLARENKEAADKAKEEPVKFYLIIDEINRANLATVFGELIYGLEYRGESVATPYTLSDEKSNQITLPDNLYIIGTMNTADKSIGGIDYAIRRRFLFFSLPPEEEIIREFTPKECPDVNKQKEFNKEAPLTLFKKIETLFKDNLSTEYYKEDVQLGHTYFLVDAKDGEEQALNMLKMRFTHQIVPILREYYKDGLFNFSEIGDDILKKIITDSSYKFTDDDFEALCAPTQQADAQ